MTWWLSVALAGLAAAGPPPGAGGQAGPGPAEVRAAIDRLGSFEFSARMDAARVVRRAAADVATPALTAAALEHKDQYIRYRALVLLAGFGTTGTADTMRRVMGDPNDRLRAVAYAWFEHHVDPSVLPALIDALDRERSEFVRPALTRAIAAYGSDDRARQVLVPLVLRGEDFFRGSVIAALGDHGGTYALAEIAGVARLDGPLQDDAVTAIGKLGDRSMLAVLAELQQTAARDVQPTVAAAVCLLRQPCEAQWAYLTQTLAAATAVSGRQSLLRGVAHALAVLAVRGRADALHRLLDAGGPAADPARAPLALAVGQVALRNPEVTLAALVARADRAKAIELLRDAFDMLSEDFEEERFFVHVRRAYWAAEPGSPRRDVAEALIRELEF